jgi:uncharacterized protein YutE (UPF0331/DUF86 family)
MAESGRETGRARRLPLPRRQIGSRFKRIGVDRRALGNALSKFADRDAFDRAWSSEDPEDVNLVAAVERAYENLINALNEVIDLAEGEAIRRGEMGGPETQGASRWERVHAAGLTSKRRFEEMRRLSGMRRVLQHGYAGTSGTGPDAYDAAEDLLQALPGVVRDLERWVNRLWP